MFAQRRFVIGVFAALSLAVVGAPAALADDLPAPVVTTKPATGIVDTLASLNAEVITHGVPTTAYFVYGTAPDHLDQRTPDADLADTDVVPLTEQLTDVAPNATYYFAVVAENDDWLVTGDTLSFQSPSAPRVTGGAVDGITYKSATLHLHVDAHGLPEVTVSGGVGTARLAGPSFPVSVFGGGASFQKVLVPADGDVAIPLTGLTAGKTYYWTATPDGIVPPVTATGEFRTDALLAVGRPVISPARAAYGTPVTISGTVPKPGALVTLVEQGPPFIRKTIAPTALTAIADPAGAYAFDVRAERSMRYGVTFDGALPPASSRLARLNVFPAVSARLQRVKHHRFRVTGSYAPHVRATVSLFRRGAGLVGLPRESTGTFRFPARTLKPGAYEVRVTPHARPSLVLGARATVTVPRR